MYWRDLHHNSLKRPKKEQENHIVVVIDDKIVGLRAHKTI